MKDDYKVEILTLELTINQYVTEYMNREYVVEFCKKCEKYNNCWSCPPFDFDIDKYLDNYSTIKIFAHKLIIGENVACDNASQVTTELFKSLRAISDKHIFALEHMQSDSVAFVAGSCAICGKCDKLRHKPCKYPLRMRRSLESIGFDMALTSSKLFDTELKWGSEKSLPQYMFLVSGLIY